ncbi:hypothetical protein J42TS3_11590 [Paenibacillus vini]|uniref:Uncharacterized protein n=1 Tax=Paenibacillus vini TaxID=1476024 RepID=A0ABQ4M803_9BACL|nr:hypothetical protein J42TS3_11590 [Paenibacillus vini]
MAMPDHRDPRLAFKAKRQGSADQAYSENSYFNCHIVHSISV